MPTRQRVTVSDVVLERLARVSSGSLTTQLYKTGFRQPVLVGLKPLQGAAVHRFAGRAYTMRFIPARVTRGVRDPRLQRGACGQRQSRAAAGAGNLNV
jgi:regulator of RNase E activity RraA